MLFNVQWVNFRWIMACSVNKITIKRINSLTLIKILRIDNNGCKYKFLSYLILLRNFIEVFNVLFIQLKC